MRFAERWVGTVRRECTDKMLIVGAAVAAFAAGLPADAVVLGHGWDESGWDRPSVIWRRS